MNARVVPAAPHQDLSTRRREVGGAQLFQGLVVDDEPLHEALGIGLELAVELVGEHRPHERPRGKRVRAQHLDILKVLIADRSRGSW